MSTSKKTDGTEQPDNVQLGTDQHIEWDNGEVTYGHSVVKPEFKRKNSPSAEHLKQANEEGKKDVNKELKNVNLAEGEDPGSRKKDDNKGVGGKYI
ncbi:hypothetical protein [Pedobacter sandarakinus]|uniref:hypothetical protein n=1 Tax=Pedobacter sandarakinus TaxID=353156 RepID=UPI0022459D29|nr:hypothetical protein [Pedobacter sandarakinus]MCX2576155.1 hypothetical protein [Pedobacter sandarakinus]